MEFACLACVGLPAALCLFVLLVREMQSGSLAFAPLRRVLREKRFGMLTLLSIPAVAAVDLAILRAMGLAKRLDAATVLAGLFIGVPSLGIVATFWFFVMDLTEEGALVLLRKRDALRDEATPFGKAQTSPPDTKLLYGEAAAPIIATIVDEPVSSVTEEPRMSQVSATSATGPGLSGRRVFFAGKLAAMARRDAQRLVRQHGGEPVEAPDERVDAVVVGEGDSGLADLADLAATGRLGEILPAPLLEWAQAGRVQVVTETQFWRQLGLVEGEPAVRRLHTPGMLASLLSVSIDVIRRWHRRGLIVPAHTVRRLAYFDFQEVATAKRLAELLARGISPSRIERQLAGLARIMPGIERPLAQLSVIVEGRDILLRHGGGLVDAAGQLRMDFSEDDGAGSAVTLIAPPQAVADIVKDRPPGDAAAQTPAETSRRLVAQAQRADDDGDLDAAAELYRAALAAGGPDADLCFQLAELLYRAGDVAAARERYYMALEIDEEHIEARLNLGCVLAELGDRELAVAAFTGALRQHADYPDAHYHLARALAELGRPQEAAEHWRAFLALAPHSPWADEAREALAT